MTNPISSMITAIFIGLGATLVFDIWGLLVKRVFKIIPSNFCLVGRWLRYMPEGIFRHSNIGSLPPKSSECTVGWIAHYLIGIAFATAFVALAGNRWLQQPALIPALAFGIVTVSAPFFIMQPALGLGVAASKTPDPRWARVRSLINHIVFGFGLYLFGLIIKWLH